MATISSSIELYDRVTAPINRIIGALNNMVGMFESVDSAMNDGFDPSIIDNTRRELDLAKQEMREFGETTRKAEQNVDSLTSSISSMVGAYLSIQGAKKLFDLSDTAVQTTARLGFIVDDENSVESLEEKIMASAERSRASFQTTADAVAKLGMQAGKSFNSNDELIAFSELINKTFVLAGTSAQGVDSVMLQLTQAMAAGKLQGEELNAILDNAQPIVANIQKYLEEVQGIDASNIKKLASEGVLTANVIKNAMFYASKDIEEDFKNMPMTWSQVWNGVMNDLYKISQPILKFISFLADNWSILEPIVLGVASALLLYLGATKGVELATKAWAVAQAFLNGVMAMNPIFITIMAVMILIGLFYAVIAAINKFCNKSISATGMVAGAFMVLVAYLYNWFLGLVDFILGCVNYIANPWIAFANFLANLFNDPIGSIIHLFGDLADNVLGIIESIAMAIDKVFGSNLASSVQGWRSGLNGMIESAANKYGNGSYEKVADELNLSSESFGLKRWAYGDAYNTGYSWGSKLGSSLSNAFNMDDLLANSALTAENTGDTADSLDITNEDLKYLKDLAEQEVINRFTTAEIKVEMTNNNNINNEMDLDGVVDYLVVGVNDAMAMAAEGV